MWMSNAIDTWRLCVCVCVCVCVWHCGIARRKWRAVMSLWQMTNITGVWRAASVSFTRMVSKSQCCCCCCCCCSRGCVRWKRTWEWHWRRNWRSARTVFANCSTRETSGSRNIQDRSEFITVLWRYCLTLYTDSFTTCSVQYCWWQLLKVRIKKVNAAMLVCGWICHGRVCVVVGDLYVCFMEWADVWLTLLLLLLLLMMMMLMMMMMMMSMMMLS